MKRQSRAKETFLKCAQKVAEREVVSNVSHWSPLCGVVIHQPKRPKEGINIQYPITKK